MPFKLRSDYQPQGDQPRAIAELVAGLRRGDKHQTLLGVTGSGKTFSIANVVAQVQRPTLVIAHNKTLAGQLYGEFRELFPENAVEFFVSYYDYYQPEAYVPSTDTYIEKDSTINDEIDRSFVARMMDGGDDAVIVKSIIDLGHNLGLAVVAEGMENRATMQALTELGCDQGQRYHVSKPMPPERLMDWLATREPEPIRSS